MRELTIHQTLLRIPGLAAPLRILHATDLHLCECDRRDPASQAFLAWRDEHFGGPRAALDRLLAAMPKLAPDFVAVTGDLIDAVTQANLAAIMRYLRRLDVPFGVTFGNHDWPETRLDERRRLWRVFRAELGRTADFECFDLNGVQLVFLDNSDYQVDARQLQKLERVLRDTVGPVLLFYHIPVSLPSLRPPVLRKWCDPILCGDPEWDALGRRRWKVMPRDRPSTVRFRKLVLRHPRITAAFCGHVHLAHADALRGGARQFVTPPVYAGSVRLITLQPARSAGR